MDRLFLNEITFSTEDHAPDTIYTEDFGGNVTGIDYTEATQLRDFLNKLIYIHNNPMKEI